MKRGVHEIESGEEPEEPRQRAKGEADPQTRMRLQTSENEGNSGHVDTIHYGDEVPADPYERLKRRAAQKEEDRQSTRKDREGAKLQALINDNLVLRNQKEEQILKAWSQLGLLKEYVESLKSLDKLVSNELVDRLKYKGKVRDNFNKLTTANRQEISKRLGEESKHNKEERNKEKEAVLLLSEIVKLRQNEEEVDRRIEKFKQEREAMKIRLQHDETTLKKSQEKEEIQKKLTGLIQSVSEKNTLFSKEYLSVRVLTEQIGRLRPKCRVLGVLVPKENVPNPFQLQAYLRVSKHHRSLSVVQNEKILEPEKHALTDLEQRVGNVEQYAQSVDSYRIFGDVLEKGSTRMISAIPRRPPPKKTAIDFQDIVSLENSEEEDEEAAEIVPQKSQMISEGPSTSGMMEPETRKLSETAKSLAMLLAPDPIKVFNDALVLKKNSRRVAPSVTNSQCRFDMIITNDYVSTFFDNNVVLKLYSELELQLKSILYRNYEKILKRIPFYSEEYRRLLNTDRQRTDLNMHYHTNGVSHDVNAVLHSSLNAPSKINTRIFTKDQFTVEEAEVQKMKFVQSVLPGAGKIGDVSGFIEERNSVGSVD